MLRWLVLALVLPVFVVGAVLGWASLAGYLAFLVGLDFPWIATFVVVFGVLGVFPTMKIAFWVGSRLHQPAPEPLADIAGIFD